MKKRFLIPVSLLVLASCTPDANNTDSTTDVMTLSRVETFTPSVVNYETKKVAYYQDNSFVADTTFDNEGNILSRTLRTLNGSTAIVTNYDSANSVNYTATYNYDGFGKLIQVENSTNFSNDILTITYNADETITSSYADENGNMIPYIKYSKNANGLITSSMDIISGEEGKMIFENNNPERLVTILNGNENVFASFTFYDIPVPENLRKSVTDLNNMIMEQNQLNLVANFNAYYLKSYEDMLEYEKEFNEANYITHSKMTNMLDGQNNESFYYYNE